jgi:hypothetical protein
MSIKVFTLASVLLASSQAYGFSDIQELIDYVQSYRDANPEKTWDEIDNDLFFSQTDHAEADYDYAAVIGHLNTSDYEFFKNRLNLYPGERELFNKSPSRGVMTISLGYTASLGVESNYTDGFLNGNADAFRHCFWNALLTVNIERQWAIDWTNAHEDYVGNPPLEKSMDLNNNLNGQQIGAARPKAYHFQLENACLAATNVGRLVRIVNNELVPSNAEGRK